MGEVILVERAQQQAIVMPMSQILKETVEVTESVSPTSTVTDTVPRPVTKNVAPTRAVTFDETAPIIKYVAPSPGVSSREEEIIDIARCLGEFKRQLTESELQHPMIAILENRLAALRMPLKVWTVYEMANLVPGAVCKYRASLRRVCRDR